MFDYIYKNLKLIIKQLILNLKYLLSTYSMILIMFLTILIVSIVPVVFMPLKYSFGVIVTMIIILDTGMIYSSCSINFRKSTLYSNLNISGNIKENFNISVLLTMLLFSMVVLFTMIGVLEIWNVAGMLLSDWATTSHKIQFDFKKIPYIALIYCVSLLTVIVYGFSFAIHHIVKTQKTYYVIILCIFLLALLFGGGFNDFFDSYVSGGTSGNPYDFSIVSFKPGLYPKEMFIPSMLLPFFPTSQLLTSISEVFDVDARQSIQSFNIFYLLPLNSNIISADPSISTAFAWDSLYFLPYIWIIVFYLIGKSTSKIKRD